MTEKSFERLDQRTIQTVLLDEVAGRLKDLTELMAATIPKGIVENIEIQLTGTKWQRVTLPKAWFSLSLVNTSTTATIYVRVNDANAVSYPVLAGGLYHIDMKVAKIFEVNLRTTSGATAIVNLSGVI
jgi:hypothetical protein